MTASQPIPLKPDDTVVQNMTCSVCLKIVFENPLVTTAGEHVFCRPCVQQSIGDAHQEGGAVHNPSECCLLSMRQLKPLSGIAYQMWKQIAVKCPIKECTWSGMLGNYGAHADQCHSSIFSTASLMEAKNARLKKDVVELEEIISRTVRMSMNSTTTATMPLPRTFANFACSNTYYDTFRVVELTLMICKYLKYKPDTDNQNLIFHCVQNCYYCYKRPDPLAEDDEFHSRLEYHKVLQLLLGACIESLWFTYKQKRSLKFWARYINENDI